MLSKEQYVRFSQYYEVATAMSNPFHDTAECMSTSQKETYRLSKEPYMLSKEPGALDSISAVRRCPILTTAVRMPFPPQQCVCKRDAIPLGKALYAVKMNPHSSSALLRSGDGDVKRLSKHCGVYVKRQANPFGRALCSVKKDLYSSTAELKKEWRRRCQTPSKPLR